MKIENIYRILIDGIELYEENLIKRGFTKEDINNLIKDKKIKQTQDKYELVDLEAFFKYGMLLSVNGNIDSAIACFYKCYELCPRNNKFCYQILTIELKKQNRRKNRCYDKAFDIFIDIEKNSKREVTINNSRLYLYLFSFIYNSMPEEYKEKVSNIKWYDLILEKKPSSKDENAIRNAIVKRRFKYALELLDKLIKKQNNYSISFEMLRALLNEVIDAENKYKQSLLELVNEEKYEEIINILELRSNLMGLTMNEKNTLSVLKSLIIIIKTKELPLVKKENTNNISKIISNNDFELAYALVIAFLEEHKLDKNNNILYIVLTNINSLIYSLNNEADNNIEELAYFIKEEDISLEQAVKKYGITEKWLLLIKLIYVRDYYIESKYLVGDNLLKEVECYKGKYLEVDKTLERLKNNRDKYKESLAMYIKRRNKYE